MYSSVPTRVYLNELLNNIYILLEKGLIKQALQDITKAKKISQNYDLKLDQIKLLQLERTLKLEFERKATKETLNCLRVEYDKLIHLVSEEEKALRFFEDTFICVKRKDKKELQDVFSKFQEYYDVLKTKASSFWISIYTNSVLFLFYENVTKNFQKASAYLRIILNEYETSTNFKDEYQDRYLNILNNYFNNCIQAGRLEEIPSLANKLSSVKPRTSKNKIKKLQHLYYYNILYLLVKKNYLEVIKLAPEIEDILNKYSQNLTLNRRITLIFNMGLAFFMEAILNHSRTIYASYLQKSDKWFGKIEQEPKFETRKDIKKMTKMFLALVHFDLGNERHVEYLINTGLRYLRKEDSLESVEGIILKGLMKIIGMPEKEKRKMKFKELLIEINEIDEIDELKTWFQLKIVE